MDINNRIEREIDKTMASLDHLPKAKTDPFFYNRLEARLSETEDRPLAVFPWRIAAAIALAAAINTFALINVWQDYGNTADVAYLDSFTEEYNLELVDIYD